MPSRTAELSHAVIPPALIDKKNSARRPDNPVAKLIARLTSTLQAKTSAGLPWRGLREASHPPRQSR